MCYFDRMRTQWIVALTGIAIAALAGCRHDGADPNHWLVQIGGGGPELVYDIAETSDGRICATGSFWASVTFGEGEAARTLSTDGTQDIYVACYGGAGELTSVTQFGTHRGDEVRGIAALPDGDVVITGLFARRFGALQPQLEAERSADVFVARVDREGNQVWARRLGGSGADSGAAIAVTRNGDILLGGNFSQTLLYRLGDRVAKLNSAGSADAFVLRMDGDGEVIWARRLGGPGYDQTTAIAEDGNGRIYAGGFFENQATLDDHQPVLRSNGYNDVFVAALEPDGTPVWATALGGPRQDTLNGLAVDAQSRVHVAGSFQGEFAAGDMRLHSNGSADVYLLRLDRRGKVEHAYSFGSEHTEQVFDLARASDGTLFYVGHYQGQSDFAPGAAQQLRVSARAGDSNAYLLALDEDAQFLAVRTIGGIGVEMGFAVAALHNGQVAAAGVFNTSFDPGIAGLEPLSKRGKSDVFIMKTALQ